MDWTQKYRPDTLDDVRGNDSAVESLRDWADSWPDVDSRAVILHGKPGLGKTAAAHALANDFGWQTIEMNASETRTKDVVDKVAGGAAANGTLAAGTSGRRLVILDEADSLHGNSDRGGSKAMTEVVKEAEQPVILIANDFYEMSKTLRNRCKEIEFSTSDVSSREIAQLLRDICEAEDIDYTIDGLKKIAEKNTDDVRGAVNDLQSAAAGLEETLTVEHAPSGARDTTEDIFPFLDALFQEADPEEAQSLAYDVDETPDDLFAWVEDNIVNEYDAAELHSAYEFLARADEWLGRVRASQNYEYWKYITDNLTSGVAASRQGRHGGWTKHGPPSYWRKLGQTKGTRSTRNDIARRISEVSHVSISTARRELLPFLSALTHHCKPRELTVAMAAMYDLDEEEVAFITGSGVDTNKVEGIVEDAQEKRAEAAMNAVETGGGDLSAFGDAAGDAGESGSGDESADGQTTLGAAAEGDTPSAEADTDSDVSDDEPEQKGLSQFT